MPRINVTLSESQKKEWDEYVEENPKVDSLSDLVRTSVTEFMADESSSGGELNDAVVDDIAEIVDTLDDIESKQHQLENEVKLTRTEISDQDEIGDLVYNETSEALSEFWHVFQEKYIPAKEVKHPDEPPEGDR